MDLYKPYIDKKMSFFGIYNLYIVDWKTKETVFLPAYNGFSSFGSGQMLLREALKYQLWDDDRMAGMDNNKIENLRKAGIVEQVIDNGDVPMIIDLKTDTTINHFIMLKKLGMETSYKTIEPYVTFSS